MNITGIFAGIFLVAIQQYTTTSSTAVRIIIA